MTCYYDPSFLVNGFVQPVNYILQLIERFPLPTHPLDQIRREMNRENRSVSEVTRAKEIQI